MYVVVGAASVEAVFIMETIMEHVAKELNKTPEEVRFANLYQKGQVSSSDKEIIAITITATINLEFRCVGAFVERGKPHTLG